MLPLCERHRRNPLMTVDRVARIIAGLDLGEGPLDTLNAVCVECAREFQVDGAGIALIVDGEHRGALGAADAVSATLEQLQLTYAEGPCMDAHLGGAPVLEPDLAIAHRWPVFTPAALATGVRAVFALPLQVGSARFGSLDLYRNEVGRLSDQDIRDAVAVAGLVTTLVLMMQAGAPPDTLPDIVDQMIDNRSSVHQAAGMVSMQMGVGIEDASVALRARAYADGRPLDDVAADVVERRIRFDPLAPGS